MNSVVKTAFSVPLLVAFLCYCVFAYSFVNEDRIDRQEEQISQLESDQEELKSRFDSFREEVKNWRKQSKEMLLQSNPEKSETIKSVFDYEFDSLKDSDQNTDNDNSGDNEES